LALRDVRLAGQPNPLALRDEFRRVLPKWASANGVSVDDLLAVSVPKEDLGGLSKPAGPKRAPSKGTVRVSGRLADERVVGILADSVGRSVKQLGTELTISETAARNSVRRLEAAGRIIGAVVSSGTGRPHTEYQLV
jgi:response regulator of citrate/malate metabolism